MKNKLLLWLLLAQFSLFTYAQVQLPVVKNFNGASYQKLNNKWYFLDNVSQELLPVSSRVITLKYHSTVTENQIQSFEAQFQLDFLRKAETGWYDYRLMSDTDVLDQATSIQNSPLVSLAEVSAAIRFSLSPNDSAYYYWADSVYQWGIPIAKVNQAWNKTTGDPSVIIANIDTGTDWWHEDFQQATGTPSPFWFNTGEDAWTDPNDPGTGNGIDDDGNGLIDDWRGWDFASDTNDVSDGHFPYSNPHGTGVTGVFGARSNNYIGTAGVAGGWNGQGGIKIMLVKIGEYVTGQDTLKALVFDDALLYAAKNGADVVQIAFGAVTNFASIDAAIELAYKKYGCVLVGASGNALDNIKPVVYPASHPLVISVAKTNYADRSLQSHTGENLDLGAPGHVVPILVPNDQYEVQTGTSEAAPFVSGIAGLMLSINPCLDNEEVRNVLIRRADKVNIRTQGNPNGYDYAHDLKKPGHSMRMGYGRVNALAAVNTAEAMKESNLDLYIKDHYSDFGYSQSYPDTARFDDWSDIWVRNQPDGYVNQEMEEIEYSMAHDAYVYVKVRNKSCIPSDGTDSLKVYWTKASTVSSWPQNWNGSVSGLGDIIGGELIPALDPGEDTIMEFSWTIDPEPLQSWGTCIMARIVSDDDLITPDPNLAIEIRNNNNIAIRNLQVMDIYPGKAPPVIGGIEYPYGIQILTGEVNEGDLNPVDLALDDPYQGPSLVEAAEVRLYLSEELWQLFENTEPQDRIGIQVVGDKELLVTSPHPASTTYSLNPVIGILSFGALIF